MTATGLLVSQIGYDAGDPMRALVRGPDANAFGPDDCLRLRQADNGAVVLEAAPEPWGEAWGSYWWTFAFDGTPAGEYTLEVARGNDIRLPARPLTVAANRLWEASVTTVALDQFEERARRARAGKGWKDCGAILREANSHAAAIIGLGLLSHTGFEWLTAEENQRLLRQLVHGCDYLVSCQEHAARLGLPAGSLVHDLCLAPQLVPADAAQACVALAQSSRLLSDDFPSASRRYLEAARALYAYLRSHPYAPDAHGFSALNHGAPEDFTPRRDELMTRELLTRLWAAKELWMSGGDPRYQDDAVSMARQILDRQVREDEAEDGLWGHFRTFADSSFTEKANIHHHMGYDTGGLFPWFVYPLMEMQSRWYDHPDAPRWRQAVKDFALGFLAPACRRNPFLLIPSGVFGDEGLLTFAGPWHGINATYAWGAFLATHLERATGDPIFREITVANLQWIAGLNAGLTGGMFRSTVRWVPEMPADVAEPYSMIDGIGHQCTPAWSHIPGSILNGFSANPQFRLVTPTDRAHDRPTHFTDEDWIPHGAAWVAALAAYRQTRYFIDPGRARRASDRS